MVKIEAFLKIGLMRKRTYMEQTILAPEAGALIKKERISGIELLKIIGIFLIVISHVTQTLGTDSMSVLGFNDYYINLNNSTTNFQIIVLQIFQYFGQLGNMIFFVCSAWFLIDKDETNTKKLLRMILDVFIISICWLIPMLFIEGRSTLGWKNIVRSLLPTFFANNWYITYYIIFCFIYPFMNMLIRKIDQKKHLMIALVLFVHLFIIFLDLRTWLLGFQFIL